MLNPTTIKLISTETKAVWQETDVRLLLPAIRQQAVQAGLSNLLQTKLITAASELARNMLCHAAGGQVLIQRVQRGAQAGVRLIFEDRGPGIADVEQAMRDGYSTGLGLGLGLPGARRLTSEFKLTSAVGEGTTVTVIQWQRA